MTASQGLLHAMVNVGWIYSRKQAGFWGYSYFLITSSVSLVAYQVCVMLSGVTKPLFDVVSRVRLSKEARHGEVSVWTILLMYMTVRELFSHLSNKRERLMSETRVEGGAFSVRRERGVYASRGSLRRRRRSLTTTGDTMTGYIKRERGAPAQGHLAVQGSYVQHLDNSAEREREIQEDTDSMANPQIPYNLVTTSRRRIPKFNVEGTEHRLFIAPIQQNEFPYNIINAMVHDVFARK